MDNAILFLAVLLFGWLVMYNYGYRRGFNAGLESERDYNARRFIRFSIERFGVRNTRRYRPNHATRHAPVSEERFNGF